MDRQIDRRDLYLYPIEILFFFTSCIWGEVVKMQTSYIYIYIYIYVYVRVCVCVYEEKLITS